MSYALPATGSPEDHEGVKLAAWFAAKVEVVARHARQDGEDDFAEAAQEALTAGVRLLECWTHRDDDSPQTGPRARGEAE